MLRRFIEQLVGDLGMPLPQEPVKGAGYELKFEPDLKVVFNEQATGVIKLQAIVAPLPKEKRNEYLNFVMSAHLFEKETGANFLGVDAEEKQIVLLRFIEPEGGYPEFKIALEEFLNYCETWRIDTKLYA